VLGYQDKFTVKQNRNLPFLLIFLIIASILTLLIPTYSSGLQYQATEEVKRFLLEAEELLEEYQFHATLS